MKQLVKKLSAMLALVAACVAFTACGGDDKDEQDLAREILGKWEVIAITNVTVDENGTETEEDGILMQSQEWTFGEDGIQYIVNNGIAAKDNYQYTISGRKINLIALNPELPEAEGYIEKIENNTMKLDYYTYGDKTNFQRFIFNRKQ